MKKPNEKKLLPAVKEKCAYEKEEASLSSPQQRPIWGDQKAFGKLSLDGALPYGFIYKTLAKARTSSQILAKGFAVDLQLAAR